jgi:hypothetical protein
VRTFIVVLVSKPVMVKLLVHCKDEFTFGTSVRQVNKVRLSLLFVKARDVNKGEEYSV